MHALVADPRCRTIISIDRRAVVTPGAQSYPAEYPDNTTAATLDSVADMPVANLDKVIGIDASTKDLRPAHRHRYVLHTRRATASAALRYARLFRQATRDHGVVVFRDRLLVQKGMREFRPELARYRAYPLSHELLVVELNVSSLAFRAYPSKRRSRGARSSRSAPSRRVNFRTVDSSGTRSVSPSPHCTRIMTMESDREAASQHGY
jgi:hypothetical protein